MKNEQLMKFQITNDRLKMEIKISDLIFLFHNSPNNLGEEDLFAKVRRDKKREFAEWIVEQLQDLSEKDENNTVWGQPFENIFSKIFDGYEVRDDIFKYLDERWENNMSLWSNQNMPYGATEKDCLYLNRGCIDMYRKCGTCKHNMHNYTSSQKSYYQQIVDKKNST